MRDFLSEFVRGSDAACTMIVMDEGYMEQPRRYHLRPFRILVGAVSVVLGAAVLAAAVVAFTPVRTLIPGYGTAKMEQNARQNARHVAALEDSLRKQRRYMLHLQSLMAAPVDSSFVAEVQQAEVREAGPSASGALPLGRSSVLGSASVQEESAPSRATRPRFASTRLPEQPSVGSSSIGSAIGGDPMSTADLDALQFPVAPPAKGFVTRGFNAKSGHYAVDIAAEAGTPVRSIGDGYVVMADRTEEGGHAIAVQHAGGYLSLYKHNRNLLKEVGERVETREVIAESGNSGEITTGPHLHLELWHNGLAQDPAAYFIEG